MVRCDNRSLSSCALCSGPRIRPSTSMASVRSSYGKAAPGQLHATFPGPEGARACLSLYDVCPHTSGFTGSAARCEMPYLHHELPSLPSSMSPRTVEYVDNRGRTVVETTRSSLQPLLEPSRTQVIEYVHEKDSRVSKSPHSVCSTTQHPQDTTITTAYLAPLVLSKHSPTTHHIREPSALPPLRPPLKTPPPLPTVYLLSFSTDRTPTTRAFAALLNDHLPHRIPLQYTIDARSFLVPPSRICENYSGVAEIVQREVLRDPRAQREIDCAVGGLMGFVAQERRETGVAVCCTAGTHRSVAIAELIARGVRRGVREMGSARGVKVVVRHVHRVRGVRDPY